MNEDGQQGNKEDRRFKDYHSNEKVTSNTNHTHQSSRHIDGKVSVETINGKTYIHGAGVHNINGQIITIKGDETWVVTEGGESYILEDDGEKRERKSFKRKAQYNLQGKVRPSDGVEKHYLNQSSKEGHLDWIGYNNTILEPSTQQLYQLPAFCKDFHNALVKDRIIDDGGKILFYFGKNGAYVNGQHIPNGQDSKYRALARKYDIPASKGWNIELDGENVLIVGSVRDVDQLRKDLRQALTKDRLISNREDKILVKIEGNRFLVNGKVIPEGKISSYFQLLRQHRITPAPGKIIQMGRKNNKGFIHVGYGGDNSFLGTFSTD